MDKIVSRVYVNEDNSYSLGEVFNGEKRYKTIKFWTVSRIIANNYPDKVVYEVYVKNKSYTGEKLLAEVERPTVIEYLL